MEVGIILNDIEKINKFLNITQSFESGIDLIKGSCIVDAKSIFGIYSMDLSHPVIVKIHSVDNEELEQFNIYMKEFVYND